MRNTQTDIRFLSRIGHGEGILFMQIVCRFYYWYYFDFVYFFLIQPFISPDLRLIYPQKPPFFKIPVSTKFLPPVRSSKHLMPLLFILPDNSPFAFSLRVFSAENNSVQLLILERENTFQTTPHMQYA